MADDDTRNRDCTCPRPDHGHDGFCRRCGGFACPYAEAGQTRCSPVICDCFVDVYPDSPQGLHPEAYVVTWPRDE